MLHERSGPRWDGRDWPPRGGQIDVSDEEGIALCGQGIAAPVVADEVETPEGPLAVATEVRQAEAASFEPGESGEPAELESRPAVKPIVNSPKAHWVEHAVSLGFDRAEAAAMPKADLIAAVKEG